MTDAILSQTPAAAGTTANSGRPANIAALRDVAQEFESVFLAQVLSQINQGLGGGPQGSNSFDQGVFHEMFNDEVAKLISRSGGVGVADAVLKEMLKVQEVA
jgi:flagellar protein FlgJ